MKFDTGDNWGVPSSNQLSKMVNDAQKYANLHN
jgi:hypothetical protein